MEVIINNRSGISVNIDFFRELAEEILNFEKVDAKAELSVTLVSEDGMRKLNEQYRGIKVSTDVLSFPQSQDDFEGPYLLGDVVISPKVAQDQALKYRHSFEKEMTILLIHGILHLLGFDHETAENRMMMQDKEEKILNNFLAEKKIE